jgi:hypothetical protein
VGDSGGNSQALEEQPLKVLFARPTREYEFCEPKFADFFRAQRAALRLRCLREGNYGSGPCYFFIRTTTADTSAVSTAAS